MKWRHIRSCKAINQLRLKRYTCWHTPLITHRSERVPLGGTPASHLRNAAERRSENKLSSHRRQMERWSRRKRRRRKLAGIFTLLAESLTCSESTCAWGSMWERLANAGGSLMEETVPDLHCSNRGPMHQRQTGIFILHRAAIPLSNLPSRLWKPSIHCTWIHNEIISLPPRALITQPWWLDGSLLSRTGK